MSRSLRSEWRVPIPFTEKALYMRIDGTRRKLEFILGPRSYDVTFVLRCPHCLKEADEVYEDTGRTFWHSNVGAGLLWCPTHGLLAIENMRPGDIDNRFQMTDEEYEKFVEER